MTNKPLRIVDEASTEGRSVLIKSGEPGPFFVRQGPARGDINLICGNCDFILVEGLQAADSLQNLILKCPECGACNDTQ